MQDAMDKNTFNWLERDHSWGGSFYSLTNNCYESAILHQPATNLRVPMTNDSNTSECVLNSYIWNKFIAMGLLNQKGKSGDKKKAAPKNAAQGSKFIASKSTKAAGGPKKPMTGGSQRGS